MMSRKTECIFESAFDLHQQCVRESAQSSDDPPFINRFDLLSHNFRCKRETSRALGNHNMTGRQVSCVFRQRHDNNELAEVIDAIVGYDNGGSRLLDLDADGGVKINEYDITPPYACQLIPPFLGSPTHHRRSASIRSA